MLFGKKVLGRASREEQYLLDEKTNVAWIGSGASGRSALTGRDVDSHFAVAAPDRVLYGSIQMTNSTILVTDQAGEVVSRPEYEPFGMAASPTGDYPFGFAGRSMTTETISYNRWRHLDLSSGVFLSQDPIGFSGGTNLYAYSANNPISNVDPLGLQAGTTGGGGDDNAACTLKCYVATNVPTAVAATAAGYRAGGWRGAGVGFCVSFLDDWIVPPICYGVCKYVFPLFSGPKTPSYDNSGYDPFRRTAPKWAIPAY
jgi:RHS repeat-associated protein